MVATFEKVTENAAFYFANVIKNREELIIGSDSGNLIVIPEEDWNHMNETMKLLLDSKSLVSLLEGQAARLKGSDIKRYSVEEVFNEL
jgi:PHD/YefM family antitoxin component YafN of YafNO toxin-antitoxin module